MLTSLRDRICPISLKPCVTTVLFNPIGEGESPCWDDGAARPAGTTTEPAQHPSRWEAQKGKGTGCHNITSFVYTFISVLFVSYVHFFKHNSLWLCFFTALLQPYVPEGSKRIKLKNKKMFFHNLWWYDGACVCV